MTISVDWTSTHSSERTIDESIPFYYHVDVPSASVDV